MLHRENLQKPPGFGVDLYLNMYQRIRCSVVQFSSATSLTPRLRMLPFIGSSVVQDFTSRAKSSGVYPSLSSFPPGRTAPHRTALSQQRTCGWQQRRKVCARSADEQPENSSCPQATGQATANPELKRVVSKKRSSESTS